MLGLSTVFFAHLQPEGNNRCYKGTIQQIPTNKLTLSSASGEIERSQRGWSDCWRLFLSNLGRERQKKLKQKLAE